MQSIIPFQFEPELGEDDFVRDGCNVEAHGAIYHTQLWPEKRLMILGDIGSGKTHLANIWAHIHNAEIFSPLKQTSFLRPIVIEDLDGVVDEDMLFHCLNSASQNDLPVLLTSRIVPQYKLADLKSRIDACYKVSIKDPSTEVLKAILLKNLCDKQIKVSADVLDYISVRMTRKFSYIQSLASVLDKASAQEKRNITIPFVRRIMEDLLIWK